MARARSEEFDADIDLTPKLLELFLRLGPEQLRELATSIGAADSAAARAQAHKLKGGLYAVGASRLAESVEQLRMAIAGEQWEEVQRRYREVEPRFAAIVAALDVVARNAGQPANRNRGDAA